MAKVFIGTFIVAIYQMFGCQSVRTASCHGGESDYPAVVPLLRVEAAGTEKRLIGSGIPRPQGKVITALHVVAQGFPTPFGDCEPILEVGGFRPHTISHTSPDPADIAWLQTPCLFDRVDKIESRSPIAGTSVRLAGYPVAVFDKEDFKSGSTPKPVVLVGTVVDEPDELVDAAPGIIWIQIPDIRSEFMHGFSGSPCAYKNELGEWVVFGIAQFRFGDEVWEFLGVDLPIRINSNTLIAVAPIPALWAE